MRIVAFFVGLVSIGYLTFSGGIAMAQENDNTEEDPRITEANARQAISEAETAASNAAAAAANAKAAEVAAERAALLAAFPESETKGASGTATAESGGYYANHLTHEALEDLAKSVSVRISEVDSIEQFQIFLVSGTDFQAAVTQWRLINNRLNNLSEAIKALLNSLSTNNERLDFNEKEGVTATALLTAAPQILGAAADIAAFFRSDIKATGLTVTAASEDFTAMVLDRLLPEISVRYPSRSLQADTGLTTRLSELIALDAQLRDKKDAIVRAGQKTVEEEKEKLAPILIEIARLERQIKGEKDQAKKDELEQDKAIQESQKTRFEERIAFLEELVAGQGTSIDTLRENVQTLRTALNTPNKDGVTPLQAADPVATIVSAENPALLEIEVSNSGGERQIKTATFGSGRVSYLGGASVRFNLTDKSGQILATGSFSRLKTESMKRGEFFIASDQKESGR